jgi:hypothetical protein
MPDNVVESGLHPRIHKCDVCAKEGYWDESWAWWGSLGSEDNGYVIKFCSDTCADCDPEAVWKRKYGKPSTHKMFHS